jgi:carbonic anhydrase
MMVRFGKTKVVLAAFLSVYVAFAINAMLPQQKAGGTSALPEASEQKQEPEQEQKKEQKHVCTFACAVNCMDGRVQDPVKDFVKTRFGVDYVDAVTEKGPNKILCDNTDQDTIARVKEKVDTSVNQHGSKVIAIVGHCDCKGNPAGKEHQIEHLKKARDTIKAFGFDAEIILLWVKEDWKTVEIIE